MEKLASEIVAEIGFTFTSSNNGEYLYINDVLEGETIAIYGTENSESAYAHYLSLLSEEQREALNIRNKIEYELQMEEQSSRELSWGL